MTSFGLVVIIFDIILYRIVQQDKGSNSLTLVGFPYFWYEFHTGTIYRFVKFLSSEKLQYCICISSPIIDHVFLKNKALNPSCPGAFMYSIPFSARRTPL